MASPPYSQSYTTSISPPYPAHSQLPQPPKRRHSDMLPTSNLPSTKRRKASMLSTTSIQTTSSHPLRQTSFPPELNINPSSPGYSRSPSMDTMSISGSIAGGGNKRKRSKKSKGGKENDDAPSSQRGKSAVPGETNGRIKREPTEEAEDEDFGDEPNFASASTYAEESAREKEKQAILTGDFDAQQWKRFEAWRSSKLADSVVRRIVNQTLSQSVPPAVILAVKSAAKIYAGNLIENARKVQNQWLETSTDPNPPPRPRMNPPEFDVPAEGEQEKRRGPLLPDHLREAQRRHMMEADGGLVGQLGLWQQSQGSGFEVPRFGVKNRGKRLFK